MNSFKIKKAAATAAAALILLIITFIISGRFRKKKTRLRTGNPDKRDTSHKAKRKCRFAQTCCCDLFCDDLNEKTTYCRASNICGWPTPTAP